MKANGAALELGIGSNMGRRRGLFFLVVVGSLLVGQHPARAEDYQRASVSPTARHQLWFVPGVKFQVIPGVLGLQAYFEYPIYQYFNGEQLGGDFNFRLTATYSLPLKKSDEDDE